jgi:putative glycosyltransferase (TIGR04372 family)
MMRKEINIIMDRPLLLIALPISFISLLLICFLRPFINIRIGFLRSDRIGHFTANTELYLCEKDERRKKSRLVDLFYFPRKPCNKQLAKMWKRNLIILPWFFLRPMDLIIRSFNFLSTFHACEARGAERDIDHLLDKTSPHLVFTPDEETKGEIGLESMGIPKGAKFICMTVRDNAYLSIFHKGEYSYHDYRDSNVQNYVLAAENLAERGYFVIRMGVKVNEAINSKHPRVIDYATNGMRTDFMDIYLGAKCFFAISNSTGFDGVPEIFRRPIAYVNMAPIGWLRTYSNKNIAITKHYLSTLNGAELTLQEIFSNGAGYYSSTAEFSSNNITLIENTPEEIKDLVVEMTERLNGDFKVKPEDEELQRKFFEIFPSDIPRDYGVRWHGEMRSRFGAVFLRNNPSWLS